MTGRSPIRSMSNVARTKVPLVVLGVTGSIAAYKACEIVRLFGKASIDIQAILTREGREFITPLTLQTLSRNKTLTDMFELPETWDPVHISLADRADAVLIAPATAAVIGKLAAGICDDLLTCVVIATKAPVLIAPAMNDAMYRHPVVRENIAKLKKIGYRFIGPAAGRLACGKDAVGCLAEPAEIVRVTKGTMK